MIRFFIVILGIFLLSNGFIAYASEVRVNAAVGGYMSKSVTSMREMKFKNVVPQQHDFSCGAASMATILKYGYGVDEINEANIVKEMIEKGDPEKIKGKG